MNDRHLLDDLGVALDAAPDPQREAQRRRAVLTSFTAAPNRRERSWRWKTLTAGAGVAVALSAVWLIAPVVTTDDIPPAASAQAAEVLHRAADAVRDSAVATPDDEQFVFFEQKTWAPVVGSSSPQVTVTRTWRSVDGTRDGLIWTDRPVPGERAETPIPGCRDGRAAEWGDNGATRACTADPAYRGDLPTEQADMLRYLQKTSNDPASDEQVFARIGDVVQQSHLAPRAQAALYEAATLIPGVVTVPQLRDSAGRTAVAVAYVTDQQQYQLLFDPASYQFLGWQVVPIDAPGQTASMIRHQALIRVAVVDDVEQLPTA